MTHPPPDKRKAPTRLESDEGSQKQQKGILLSYATGKLYEFAPRVQPSPTAIMEGRASGSGPRSGTAPAADKGAKSPWYSPHTGTLIQEWQRLNELRKGRFYVKIHPAGVILEAARDYEMPVPEEQGRGEIEGFSHAAARRCRESFMTLHVPGFDLYAATLTTHQIFTPTQWRAIMKRFRMALKRAGFAGLWRVELQKRKAPHAHVAFWLPPSASLQDVTMLWLKSTGEWRDMEAVKHAVQGCQIAQDEHGWAVYMALHHGKHKADQLGWLGKQWGIWNAEILHRRTPEIHSLEPLQHTLFLRILRHLEQANRRTHARDLRARGTLYDEQKALAIESRPNVKPLHRGNLLRCMSGATASALVAAITSKRVGLPDRDLPL